MARKCLPTLSDFESRIYYSIDGCWYWIGVLFNNGYGQFRNRLAHRVSYEIFCNVDLTGYEVYHTCRNKSCVNPSHLGALQSPSPVGLYRNRFGRIKMQSDKNRFEKYIMPEPNTGCWFWTARINPAGYGVFGVGKKKHKAHRYSFELYRHPIQDNKLVCHHCDTPACVNPDHLFLGTYKDNVQDMVKKGRASWQRIKRLGANPLDMYNQNNQLNN